MLRRGENKLTWKEATALVDAIAASLDAGAWHASIAIAPQGQGYAVIMRHHGHHNLHYVWSKGEFTALCNQLMQIEK